MPKPAVQDSSNPFKSLLWIPLISLPILASIVIPKPVNTLNIPQEFFKRQINYFSQRNAVVYYWDQIFHSLGSRATTSVYSTRMNSPQLIKVKAINQSKKSYSSTQSIELELTTQVAKSKWTISLNPLKYQLIRVNDSKYQTKETVQRMLKHQLNWFNKIDSSQLSEAESTDLMNLLIKIHDRQYHKSFQKLKELAEAHQRLLTLLKKPSFIKTKTLLQGYLNYQTSIILLEFAARTNQNNLKQNILLAKRYKLLDKFYVSNTDIFKLPLSSLQMEINVSIDTLSTPEIQSNFIRALCENVIQKLQAFDLKKAPWKIITTLARSYQIAAKTYNFDHPENKNLNDKFKNLVIPDQDTSMASSRIQLQPEGSDFKLGSPSYLQRLAQNLHIQNIKLREEKIPDLMHFSQSVQALKLNNKHYVIDTEKKSCFILDGLQFRQISSLPNIIPALSQAIVQDDPISGRSRVVILGGYPDSNLIFTSNDLITFDSVTQAADFDGRFYFGISKFTNPSNGFQSTILVGGTKGQKNDLARFEDTYQSIDGVDWNPQGSLNWLSRHSFAMTQLKDSLLLMGGCRTFQSGPCYSEIWSSSDGKVFDKVISAPWSARGGMAIVNTSEGLLLFGGADDRKIYSDLWKTDDGMQWVKVDIKTLGSTHSQLIYDEDRLWIIGGISATGDRAPTRSFKIIRNAIQFL